MPYKVKITDYPKPFWQCDSECLIDQREDAIAYLWALTKQDVPQYGVCWMPNGVEPMTNFQMFNNEPPDYLGGKVEKFVEQLNEPDIESLVVQGLNLVFKGLLRHIDDKEFIDKVTKAAREYAIDCFQEGELL